MQRTQTIGKNAFLCGAMLSLFCLTLSFCVLAQVTKWQLRKVEFTGLVKQDREKMIEASGLKIGQEVDQSVFNQAVQTLLTTGAFRKVGYRYRYSGNQVDLTFEVEETSQAGVRCVFDNFVWFSDQEITEAIRHQIPDFEGTVMEGDLPNQQIKTALYMLLQSRKLTGEIENEVLTYMGSSRADNVFRVKNAGLSVCEVQVIGANDKIKGPLIEAAKELLNKEYSRSDTQAYNQAALIPVYREHGYLKARLLLPQAVLGDSGKCQQRVIVRVPAEDGLLYQWDKAEWTGQQLVDAAELEKLMSMKSGEVANARKIGKGFAQISGYYYDKGYMEFQMKPKLSLDDARQLAAYQVEITEGPRYRMGTFTVAGTHEKEIQKLQSQWKLKIGEYYDGSYVSQYLTNVAGQIGEERMGTISDKLAVKPNRETQTVNVTLDFSAKKE